MTVQVLGHQVRTDVTKPREMLHVPTLSELDLDAMEGDEGGLCCAVFVDSTVLTTCVSTENDYKSPFTSRMWTIRAAVQRGFEALYTVQVIPTCNT